MGIASLVDKEGGERGALRPGATVGLFSYGSGAIATMYGLKVKEGKVRMDGQEVKEHR